LLASSLALASAIADSGHQDPVSFHHAADAAEAADTAEQAANVAKRVAAHTEDVTKLTASALRDTRDALRQANADERTVAELDRQAEEFDSEAGTGRARSSRGRRRELEEEFDAEAGISRGRRSGSAGEEGEAYGSGARPKHNVPYDSPRGIDINSQIASSPNAVEPFGQEEPAKVLTEASVRESNGMVDQIETAQGVESKRAVYRALTKLRGATVASYDGMARAHLKNVDSYNKKHKWREEHPIRHLAEEEADVNVWAFPKTGSRTRSKGVAAAPAQAAPAYDAIRIR